MSVSCWEDNSKFRVRAKNPLTVKKRKAVGTEKRGRGSEMLLYV